MLVDKNNQEIYVGVQVSVDSPKPNDLWLHEFEGTVVGLNKDESYISVEDGDGDCWDVDTSQIELA